MSHGSLATAPSARRPAPIELTEKSYQMIAEAAGWSRDEDQDGVACFMNERGTHEYSYVETWGLLLPPAAADRRCRMMDLPSEFAQHLDRLLDFHRDDQAEGQGQFRDPVDKTMLAGHVLRVKLESGVRLLLTVEVDRT